jgi:hypothetical protein
MTPVKKGLLSGLLVGSMMAVYSNITACHPAILGGGTEACANSFQLMVGMFEFLLYFPLVALVGSFGIPLGGEIGFRVLLILTPLLYFGVAGIIIGLLAEFFSKE